ncbi:MAG: HEPN domain-containing protein [candidate division KSB1 bacterium]|nr:HEPN domain-containing protein [candidate division KSB1 bacterium]MDQ7063938.1 HEPN domain-containing protein [candidate division KSB1 bacterium]
MDSEAIAKEWYKFADMDLSAAEYLKTMVPTPIEIICYHCQQAAEKYLKRFLASRGEGIQKTHDLVLLNKKCQKHNKNFAQLENACLFLTDFGVAVRLSLSNGCQ